MAQAATANTDELLSQLAASEIDRLLNEAEAGNAEPAPAAPTPVVAEEPVAEGKERAAALEAAGFDTKEPAKEPPPAATSMPVEDERSALLQAAGFESPDEPAPAAGSPTADLDDDNVPFYLKPLVWMNAPLEQYPSTYKKILGGAGVITLVNALAVFAYLFFIKKH